MARTKIEWAERTWNPVTGCTKVSAGCQNCYAERMSKRLAGRYGYNKDDPFKITLHPDRLTEPLKWRKPQMVFVCSMGDLFHEDVDGGVLWKIFDIMIVAEKHTFLVLTKRPKRMQGFVSKNIHGEMPKNIWLGVTTENQEAADERIPILLQTPAATKFVSVEPMLGPVNLNKYLGAGCPGEVGNGLLHNDPADCPTWYDWCNCALDWVICGGETGPGARPMHPDWVDSLKDQCVEANVPFFFKSWGDLVVDGRTWNEKTRETEFMRVGKKQAGRTLDNRTWDEMPEVD